MDLPVYQEQTTSVVRWRIGQVLQLARIWRLHWQADYSRGVFKGDFYVSHRYGVLV